MKETIFSALLVLAAASAGAQQYEYSTHASGSRWNQCEQTRESARQWAAAKLKNNANDECREMGRGWRFSRIRDAGYGQAIACQNNRSWKFEITDATVECMRLLR